MTITIKCDVNGCESIDAKPYKIEGANAWLREVLIHRDPPSFFFTDNVGLGSRGTPLPEIKKDFDLCPDHASEFRKALEKMLRNMDNVVGLIKKRILGVE